MVMVMVQPVLAIELLANRLRSTPQPHLLHRPDDEVDDEVYGEVYDEVYDDDYEEPAKRLTHRTVHPLCTRK